MLWGGGLVIMVCGLGWVQCLGVGRPSLVIVARLPARHQVLRRACHLTKQPLPIACAPGGGGGRVVLAPGHQKLAQRAA